VKLTRIEMQAAIKALRLAPDDRVLACVVHKLQDELDRRDTKRSMKRLRGEGKVCTRCSTAPWKCRVCGDRCCEHRCSYKKEDGSASCGVCILAAANMGVQR
jgi:hypothetical protein